MLSLLTLSQDERTTYLMGMGLDMLMGTYGKADETFRR